MKKLFSILLFLPCLMHAQTTYDKTQDKLITGLTNQLGALNTREYKIEFNDSVRRLDVAALKSQVLILQNSVAALVKQNAVQVSKDSAMQELIYDVQDIAVKAVLEANKKDTLMPGDGITIDALTKKISVTKYTQISASSATATQASADVTSMAAKLAAAILDITNLKAINTKLKAQYP